MQARIAYYTLYYLSSNQRIVQEAGRLIFKFLHKSRIFASHNFLGVVYDLRGTIGDEFLERNEEYDVSPR